MSWPLVELASLEGQKGDFVDGPFGSNLKATEYVESGVPIIQLKNIKPNAYIAKDLKFITPQKAGELSRHSYAPGDVVVAKLGAVGTACIIPEDAPAGIIVADVVRFRGDSKRIDHRYLSHYLNSSSGQRAVMKLSRGSTRVRTNLSDLKKVEIPLPPLPEQKRIAAILDKADAIRRKRQQAIQLADDFLRAVFLDMFGDPASNPKGWEVKSVADLIRAGAILQVQDGNHGNDHPKVSDFTGNGIPFVTANVVRRGKILFEQCYYLDRSWLDKLRIGFAKPRDVLISHKGSLGFTAVLDDTYEDYIFSPQTTYYRVSEEKLLPEYLKGYFDSGFFQGLFAKEGVQSTRAYLGITRQKDLPIMIPEMSAQIKFLDILSKYENLSEKLFEPTASSDLFSSLSQKAFSGQL